MSRSGYSKDYIDDDLWGFICYRGAVNSAFRGKRGQSFLAEAVSALDALPKQELAAHSLQTEDGSFCLLGAVGRARGLDMSVLDPDDIETVAAAFGVAEAMAREIVFMNDEGSLFGETPERRFERMRRWVSERVKAKEQNGTKT